MMIDGIKNQSITRDIKNPNEIRRRARDYKIAAIRPGPENEA